MNKYIFLLFLMLSTMQIQSFGQHANNQGFWTNTRVGLSATYDMFNRGVGFIVKGEKSVFSLSHFKGHAGIAFQYGRLNEKDLLLEPAIKGGSNELGLFSTFKLEYYPFKRIGLYIGLEPFAGLTIFNTKGRLSLPEYEIDESYSNSYSFVNYGLSPSIEYSFGKLSAGIFTMVSLKGVLDQGRYRLGDKDSRIIFGVNISYKLNVLQID